MLHVKSCGGIDLPALPCLTFQYFHICMYFTSKNSVTEDVYMVVCSELAACLLRLQHLTGKERNIKPFCNNTGRKHPGRGLGNGGCGGGHIVFSCNCKSWQVPLHAEHVRARIYCREKIEHNRPWGQSVATGSVLIYPS